MQALALSTGLTRQSRNAAQVRKRVTTLSALFADEWRATEAGPLETGPRLGWWRQFRNYRGAIRLVDDLALEIEHYPEEPSEQAEWRLRLRERIGRFGERRLGWPAGYRDLVFADAFFEVTVQFVRRARAFDPELGIEELGQALRNVWIVNSLQMIFDLPVELSSSVLAYSLLYPYTDNLLDDPRLSAAAKQGFNRRLERRLAGRPTAALDPRERRVHELVGWIEDQYPRAHYPEVFDSLLAIHHAQTRSLHQHGERRSEAELLAISVEKGGCSVLADGYLAAGRLSDEEAEFCFGYGVFLQLLDDLQDVETDREARHWTLFSARRGRLDPPCGRLHRFLCAVLEGSPLLSGRRHQTLRDLIRRNCTYLLIGAIADNPRRFSRWFRWCVQRRWPFRFAAMRRLRSRLRTRHRSAIERLQERHHADSPESLCDLLL